VLLYIATTNQVISTALIVESTKEGKAYMVQRLGYYLSEVLSPAKQWYPHYHKLAYGVFLIVRKLR
jgi:hypothetical protein